MKKIIGIFFVIVLALNFTTVSYAASPYIESVKINADDTITMYVGEEITLEAEAEPQGWSHAYMAWGFDVKDIVAVIADDGTTAFEPPVSTATIVALKEGTVVVTVYADLWISPSKDEWTECDSITINVLPNENVLGDANGDGEISVKDVALLRRYVSRSYGDTINEQLADVNKDNAVDVKDVVIIRRYLAGGYGVEL